MARKLVHNGLYRSMRASGINGIDVADVHAQDRILSDSQTQMDEAG
jgi:hypothetical protein